ncbi:MAG: DHH family phosphoesterase [Bacillota bacterium]|nr:DHH family phosphoesterase [Bacillota bacterium]
MNSKFNRFTNSSLLYIVIIMLLIGGLFFYGHFAIGAVTLTLLVGAIICNINNAKVKKDEWKKFIEDFSSQLDVATRSTLVRLPFPLIIIGDKGDILWYNQNSTAMLNGLDILGRNVKDIFSDIKLVKILNGSKTSFQYVKIENKYYDIYTSVVDTADNKFGRGKVILLYFCDVTDKYEMKSAIDDSKESIALVEIDNLDEVIKTTEEDKKPLLIAAIETNINAYAQNIEAAVKKYSSNKYIFAIQNKYIEKEMEKKFDILDSLREINIGNKLAVTLSMGIGKGGNTPLENYKYAITAKELALGRGGDQVVVKQGEKLSFYGGKTKEIEKRTKVRARVIAHSLVDLVKESTNVFIMGHINPDMDCFGASIGLYSAVNAINKQCYIVLDDYNAGISDVLAKVEQLKEYEGAFINSNACLPMIGPKSLLIVVDVNSSSYIQNPDILKLVDRVVVIDHHRRSINFIEDAILSYIETYASSTSEMVTEILQYMIEGHKLKTIEAEILLAGICVDTKNFCFKTGVRTFEAAAFLRKQGADTIDVKKLFSSNLDNYIKKSEIIKSAKVVKNIAIAVCPPKIEDTIIAAQAADELVNITGIQASFVAVKIGDDVYISGRSLGDINVQLILESLGGGGHMTIAGAKLASSSLKEAVKKLEDAINKYLRESE